MSDTVVRIPITNIYADGDYTGIIYVGSQKRPANVLFDTGSSSLALDGKFYDPSKDTSAKITNLAQEVSYEDNSNWIGGVVKTNVGVGTQPLVLPQINVAVAYHESSDMFGKSNGILGLAYTKLNNAFELPGPTISTKVYLQSNSKRQDNLSGALFHAAGKRGRGGQQIRVLHIAFHD